MKLVTKATAFFDRAMDVMFFLSALLIVLMMLGIGFEVFVRYFLGNPISEMFELVEYAIVFTTFLGTAYVLKVEGHVKMEVVLNRLSTRTQDLLNCVTSIICAIMWLLLTWYGAKVTLDYFQIGYYLPKLLSIPAGPIFLVIPLGGFLLFVQFLRRANGSLKSFRTYQAENSAH